MAQTYPLEGLMRLRNYRADESVRRKAAAELRLSAAVTAVGQAKKKLEDYCVWLDAEEERRYSGITGKVLKQEELDGFKRGLAEIRGRIPQLEQEVDAARQKVEEEKSAVNAAAAYVRECDLALRKLQEHRKIWQQQLRLELERIDDRELEDFTRKKADMP